MEGEEDSDEEEGCEEDSLEGATLEEADASLEEEAAEEEGVELLPPQEASNKADKANSTDFLIKVPFRGDAHYKGETQKTKATPDQ